MFATCIVVAEMSFDNISDLQVVPFATVLASRRCSVAEAAAAIKNAKSLRTLVQSTNSMMHTQSL